MAERRRGKRGPGRPANPIQRRELVAIAQRAFAEEGYAGTSLSRIAELVGIQKASLYYHYPSKEALYLAVMQELIADLRGLVANARLGEGDFVSRIDRLGSLVVDYLASHADAGRLLAGEMVGGSPYMKAGGREDVEATLKVITGFLRAGMNAGEFRPQDPRQLTLSIIGLHLFYFAAHGVTTSFMGEDIFLEEMVRARKDALLPHVRSLVLAE